MNNLVFLVVIAIALFIVGVVVGVNYKNKIDARVAFIKRVYEENKKMYLYLASGMLFGLMLGIFITLTLQKNSMGMLADWISSIGTLSAVIVSLWLATGRKSRLKVSHGQKFSKLHKKQIYFIAYNLSDVAISLEFYGVKKASDKLFKRMSDINPKVIEAGKFQEESLDLDFIKQNLKIDSNYKGNIISCFAEPDGTRHCEVINWEEEMVRFRKLDQNVNAEK